MVLIFAGGLTSQEVVHRGWQATHQPLNQTQDQYGDIPRVLSMHTPIQALLHQMKKVPLTNIGPFCDCLLSLCKVILASIASTTFWLSWVHVFVMSCQYFVYIESCEASLLKHSGKKKNMAWLELFLSKCCRASICQCSHTSIQLAGTISLFKGYMVGFLFLSHMCETSNGKVCIKVLNIGQLSVPNYISAF